MSTVKQRGSTANTGIEDNVVASPAAPLSSSVGIALAVVLLALGTLVVLRRRSFAALLARTRR